MKSNRNALRQIHSVRRPIQKGKKTSTENQTHSMILASDKTSQMVQLEILALILFQLH